MAEAGDTRAGIGTRLRAAREKKGLTLLQAAERLHLDSRILEWLEAENFAALGAPVYARGHLRHYAELVDESPAQLQELYAEATRAAPTQPDLTKIARGQPEFDAGRFAVPAMIGLVAIAVIGTVWWFIQTSEHGHPATAQAQPQTHSMTQPGAVDGAGAADTGSGAPGAPAQPAPAAPAMANTKPTTPGARSAATNTLVTSTPNNRTAHAADSSAASSAAPVSAATSGATAPAPGPRGKDGQLTLKFNADSWAEVYDATGERLFYDVGAASSTHTVRGPAPLRVVLGNAAGVTLEFNGRPAAVPASKQPDGGAKFFINAHGRTVAASPASSGE